MLWQCWSVIITLLQGITYVIPVDRSSVQEFRCKSGQYIGNEKICDGIPDCNDNSDEIRRLCKNFVCPSYSFRCAYGACIASSGACNGISECADGSDEDYQLCNASITVSKPQLTLNLSVSITLEITVDKFQCNSGQWISEYDVCDGIPNCDDRSDETDNLCSNFNCPGFAFQCNYGACINSNYICDGKRDCNDGSDEELFFCKNFASTIAPPFTWPLNDNTFSLIFEKFRCDTGQYISIYDICDGKAECSDKSDENNKTCANMTCPGYTFKCAYGGCTNGDAKCNGIVECVDGSDEDYIMCGNRLPTTEWFWQD